MATLNVIRRWALREQMSIREISRRTGMARNTVKKYLRSDEVEPTYTRRASPSKLDPYAEKLTTWLGIEATKSRKQRRNLKQIYTDLVALGFDGSYGRVAAFYRKWRGERQEMLRTAGRGTFIPLVFGPGEAFQFDWSEDWAIIGGERVKLQVAHFKLSHSRAFSVRAYLLQTHEMLFDAHNHAFGVLGGVPKRGIYDNMKTAVDKVRSGKVRDVNARFNAMVNHYLFEAEFCNPASGWEKGQIEKNVRDSRHRLWQPIPAFGTLGELNEWLELRCKSLWTEIAHGKLPGTVADVWAQEKPFLMPPPTEFLRELMDECRIALILSGSKELDQLPSHDSHLMSRLTVREELRNFLPDPNWLGVVRGFVKQCTTYDLSRLSDEAEAKRLYMVTGGNLRSLKRLLTEVALVGVDARQLEPTQETMGTAFQRVFGQHATASNVYV